MEPLQLVCNHDNEAITMETLVMVLHQGNGAGTSRVILKYLSLKQIKNVEMRGNSEAEGTRVRLPPWCGSARPLALHRG